MNCLDFRRQKLATPRELSDEARVHRDECPACAEFERSALAFEQSLDQAVRVPVDPLLSQRVLLNHGLRRTRRSRMLALAATVLLVVGLGAGGLWRAAAPDPGLASAAIDHVLGEPSSFAARQQVSAEELQAALALSGARVSADMAVKVSYLHDCPVPGGTGKHIVLTTPHGRVTLITMPARPVRWRVAMDQKGMATVVRPARQGSYAIVAETPQQLAAAEAYLNGSFDWRG